MNAINRGAKCGRGQKTKNRGSASVQGGGFIEVLIAPERILTVLNGRGAFGHAVIAEENGTKSERGIRIIHAQVTDGIPAGLAIDGVVGGDAAREAERLGNRAAAGLARGGGGQRRSAIGPADQNLVGERLNAIADVGERVDARTGVIIATGDIDVVGGVIHVTGELSRQDTAHFEVRTDFGVRDIDDASPVGRIRDGVVVLNPNEGDYANFFSSQGGGGIPRKRLEVVGKREINGMRGGATGISSRVGSGSGADRKEVFVSATDQVSDTAFGPGPIGGDHIGCAADIAGELHLAGARGVGRVSSAERGHGRGGAEQVVNGLIGGRTKRGGTGDIDSVLSTGDAGQGNDSQGNQYGGQFIDFHTRYYVVVVVLFIRTKGSGLAAELTAETEEEHAGAGEQTIGGGFGDGNGSAERQGASGAQGEE